MIVLQAQTVCTDGCCFATYDPTLGFDPLDVDAENYSRPMFEVLFDASVMPEFSGYAAMRVTTKDYEKPGGILL